jgi:hypothetical protein
MERLRGTWPRAADNPDKKEESLVDDTLSYDLDGLAVDVFALTEDDTVVESLTGAHGMTEIAASCSCWSGTGSCVSA